MRRAALALLTLTFCLLPNNPVQAQPRGGGRDNRDGAQYGWLSSLSAGKEAARKAAKPLMVVLRCVP